MNDICSKRRLYGNGIAADLIHLISSHSVQIMPNVTFTAFMKMCFFSPFFKTHTLEIIVVFIDGTYLHIREEDAWKIKIQTAATL